MQVILGVIFHYIGGFASGSFYMPYKKVRGWHWENYWIIGGLFSWLIVPPLAAWVTIPGFAEIIQHTSFNTIKYTVLFGVLWGFGGLTYGLGVRYLGMSLGNFVLHLERLCPQYIITFILPLAKQHCMICSALRGEE